MIKDRISDVGDLGHLTPHAAAAVLLEKRVLIVLRQLLKDGESLRDDLGDAKKWEGIGGRAGKWASDMCQLTLELPGRSEKVADMVQATMRLYESFPRKAVKPAPKKKSRKAK